MTSTLDIITYKEVFTFRAFQSRDTAFERINTIWRFALKSTAGKTTVKTAEKRDSFDSDTSD